MTARFDHRPPESWAEDLVWHRWMFKQSRFRWTAGDAIQIAMHYSGGNTEFTTPAHLRRLDRARQDLAEYIAEMRGILAWELERARPHFDPAQWRRCLTLLDLTASDDAYLHWITKTVDPRATNPDTARIVRGTPMPNPLTHVWELRQLLAVWDAGAALLEDCTVDLLEELEASHGLSRLVGLTTEINTRELRYRIELNVEQRGRAGDPRRECVQTYPAPVPPPSLTSRRPSVATGH